MKYYIGIDLGTTNSAICSYDGQDVRVWKSPEQNDVTPSALYIDKRGNRYYGQKAYNQAPYNPDNSATLFKRFMGTNTKIELKLAGLQLTPEECSAEILRLLFGYLPEEIRNSDEIATVITVPAAFNQMKKDATLQAAKLAGIGRIALMQEPAAAVMSFMKHSNAEGIFLIYDLGGGTFDVSIAENIGGKVNLLAHGGIEMCGGRDVDRMIFNQIVVSWLKETFVLPEDFIVNPQYRTLCRLSQWATEHAKIELSTKPESIISLSETETRCLDLEGNEIYLDILITRAQIDGFISEMIADTIDVIKDTLSKTGLSASDIEKIVFIGGPTNYKPLRDKVSFELALPANVDINPMTAVAEGACIFAESIDWSSEKHYRKAINAEVKTDLNISFRYITRTPDSKARIVFLTDYEEGYAVQITSIDTGWCSGRANLKNGMTMELPLTVKGENFFDVVIYDSFGQPVPNPNGRIVITKTMATIGAIPASHSIGVEVMDKLGGTPILDFLVNEGAPLPQKGKKTFKAGQTLKASSSSSINIKLWEGSIQKPITDNRFIGVLKISGNDFEEGVIPTGAEIECEYEMADSGAIKLEVSIPCIGAAFGNKNFYSRQEGQIDLSDIDKIADDGQRMIKRIDEMSKKVADPRLERAREKAQKATLICIETHEAEDTQKAFNELLEVKKLVAKTRNEHLKEIRQMDLDSCVQFFNQAVREYAKPSETEAFDNLTRTAQRSIERNDLDFENQLEELKNKNFIILWRQDWFVIKWFNLMVANSHQFSDHVRFEELKRRGLSCVKNDQIDALRTVIAELWDIQITDSLGENMFDVANIVKG